MKISTDRTGSTRVGDYASDDTSGITECPGHSETGDILGLLPDAQRTDAALLIYAAIARATFERLDAAFVGQDARGLVGLLGLVVASDGLALDACC